ncbi:MAG: flagellar hook assembly protein FlgD [Rhodocyclaceae bacterium]|nr:flagellar hook assembly protein FlgD [Rhodocyclaceae bacterium]MDZ4215234.1 flagellar hook assembly protein FlgD [Rhodocyclaceae bacterium]
MTTATAATTTNKMPSDFLAAVNPRTKSTSDMQLSEDRFLKLLTTQLQNQDPLNPLDNAQMTSQMAQISTVNGIEKLNATLTKLMTNSSDSQVMQAASLLGRHVLVAGSGMTLPENGQTMAGLELTQPVDNATVTIRDANGLQIRTLQLGEQSTGLNAFLWDGKNDAGVQAVSGRYTFSVTAEQGGKDVTAKGLELAPVTGIVRGSSGVQLELSYLGNFNMADIRQVF